MPNQTSKFVQNAQTSVFCPIGQTTKVCAWVSYGEWLLGYRHLSVEVEDRRNQIDITLSGPMVGFGFVF